MGNIILPSYIPAYYKPGFSRERGQTEHLQASKLTDKVCKTFTDGPRYTVDNWNKTGRTIMDGSPCAISARTKQEDVKLTVSSVQLYDSEPVSLAYNKGEEKSIVSCTMRRSSTPTSTA